MPRPFLLLSFTQAPEEADREGSVMIEVSISAEVVIEQIHAYEQAGVEELMLEWFDLDDIESAEAFATDVLLRL